MSLLYENSNRRTPWHLWTVGGVSLLWNAFGCYDYLMTQTRNEGYMSSFTPQQLESFYNMPAGVVAFWALGVWGALLGSILLLARRRLAVWAFLISLVAVIITDFHRYALSDGLESASDPGSLALASLIFVVALLLFLYASAMSRRNLLR